MRTEPSKGKIAGHRRKKQKTGAGCAGLHLHCIAPPDLR
jgi:hypothetical protein